MKRLSSIPHVNPFFSFIAKGTESIVVSLYGRIKILKCKVSVFEEVLHLVNGKRSFAEITEVLAKKYPLEAVNNFWAALSKAEVIVNGVVSIDTEDIGINHKRSDIHKKPNLSRSIALAGKGILADAVREKLDDEVGAAGYKSINLGGACFQADAKSPYEETIQQDLQVLLQDLKQSFLIACPDRCTYGWLVALNDVCLNLYIPYLFCYFNGREILLGPTVIPGKTPCYGCLIEHRCSYMREKSKVAELTFEDLLPLRESWPLDLKPPLQSVVDWVGAYAVDEALTFRQAGLLPRLIKKQLRVPPAQITDHFSAVTFEAITTCPSCFGMNRGHISFGRPDQPHPFLTDNKIILKERPVVYQQGGCRSVSKETARKLIDQALKISGVDIKVEKITGKHLDGSLYRYISSVKNRYNPQLPFIIPDSTNRGKGITDEQAYISAAFELFERISSRYYGDVEIVRAAYEEVKDLAINVKAYIGQTCLHGVMDRFEKDKPVDWIWGYSLINHCPKLVPASMVFLTETKFLGQFFHATSGGLSAGAVIEDAILQGLLEVIEHDAWIIWQANAITMPRIRNETIQTPYLARIIKHMEESGLEVIIRNYTTDSSIPVFRTWIVNDRDYLDYATNGFGANLHPDIALERSITEAYQPMLIRNVEEQLAYGRHRTRDFLNMYGSLYNLDHFNRVDILKNNSTVDYCFFSNQATGSIAGEIKKIISLIQRIVPDGDVVVVNLTKDEFNIPVVRVIVEGLQRVGEPLISVQKRLAKLPQKMGYRKDELTYKELYSGKYPH